MVGPLGGGRGVHRGRYERFKLRLGAVSSGSHVTIGGHCWASQRHVVSISCQC